MHYNRAHRACLNSLLIGRHTLEEQLLTGLQKKVLNPDVIAYTLDAFEDQLLAAVNRKSNQAVLLQRRLDTIQKQIRNTARTRSRKESGIRRSWRNLQSWERELADTKAKIACAGPRALRLQVRDTRQFVESRLRNLRSLLAAEPRIARSEIAKHVQKITLTPDGRTYVASGNWDVLGLENHGWCRGPGLHRSRSLILSSRRGMMAV